MCVFTVANVKQTPVYGVTERRTSKKNYDTKKQVYAVPKNSGVLPVSLCYLRMDLASWGTPYWKFLHACSFSYPVEADRKKKQYMFNFLHAFVHVIPCVKCSEHFGKILSSGLPNARSPHLKGRDSLSRFLVDLHNNVNIKLSKPQMEYDAVCTYYLGESTTSTSTSTSATTTASVCAMRPVRGAAAANKEPKSLRSIPSTHHDANLLIGCAIGVAVVCIMMVVVGCLVRKRRNPASNDMQT